MDSNKQESYILPGCCQHCVEADGFLGAKGCSNRECECHKESYEGVEEIRKQKDAAYHERDMLVCALSKLFPAYLARHSDEDKDWEDDWRWIVYIDLPTGQVSWHIHDSERAAFEHFEVKDNNWDGHNTERKYERLAALSKLTPLVAQKEQKEGVDYSMGMSALRCCDNGDLDEPHGCLKMPPTPTVKEESHTQGWNRAESEQCVRANVMHPENGSQESAVRYILEHFGVVIAAIASQEYQRGALYNHEGTFTRGFEAGRLQGIADAVAVVPETDSRNKHGMSG